MKTFLTLIAVALLATTALAQQQQTPVTTPFLESITVTGTGRTTVSPDRFSFTAGVQTIAASVEDAVNQNNAKVAAVVAALKRAGATDADIRTSNFSIFPQQDYVQGKMPRILGYQVSNNITVTRANVGEAGKLLQAAIAAGVNTSSGLSFEVSDPARGRDAGLRAAYQDARAKAALLAQAAGRTLGRTMQITEGSHIEPRPPHPMPMAMRAEAAAQVSDVPVESGTQQLTFTVTAVFALQ